MKPQSLIEFRELGGELIPFENNKSLCSSRADEEARQWVQNQGLSAPVAIILGLGSGRHVRVWLEANPEGKVIVIDPRSSLIKPFLTANKDLRSQVEIHVIDTVEALLEHEVLNQVAVEVPPILMFGPAAGAWNEFFNEAFATLTGRNLAGLRFFLQCYGFETDISVETMENRRLLTVKDLGLMIDAAAPGHPTASAIRVLRELVI